MRIRGSRVVIDGRPVVIAAELAKGDRVLVLRDEKGYPAWAAWRQR
jgi:hypothetical protein